MTTKTKTNHVTFSKVEGTIRDGDWEMQVYVDGDHVGAIEAMTGLTSSMAYGNAPQCITGYYFTSCTDREDLNGYEPQVERKHDGRKGALGFPLWTGNAAEARQCMKRLKDIIRKRVAAHARRQAESDCEPNWLDDARVGDGATICIGSDRYAGTIIARTENTITVREDEATVVKGSGHDGSAQYEYARDENGREMTFRRTIRPLGYSSYESDLKGWKRAIKFRNGCYGLISGRRQYRDPSF